jgi:hypothetical protein
MAGMTSSNIAFNFVDKRRTTSVAADPHTHLTTGPTVFTANGAGTATTIVGANAAPATSTNVMRLGDKFRLFATGGALKEEKVFEVTGIAVAASTTVTFTPAAAANTASGDFVRLVGAVELTDEESLDSRLAAINGTTYTAAILRQMTQNDKIHAIRVESDPSGI